MQSPLLLLLLLPCYLSLKILVYNPLFAESHARTMHRVAETLAEEGHRVTELLSRAESSIRVPPRGLSDQLIIEHGSVTDQAGYGDFLAEVNVGVLEEHARSSWIKPYASYDFLSYTDIYDVLAAQCKYAMSQPGLIDRLKGEHFDFAVLEAYDFCGYGLVHTMNLTRYALVTASGTTEWHTDALGMPNTLAYVPANFAAGSADGKGLAFSDRVSNVIAKWCFDVFMAYGERLYQGVFPGVPSMKDLAARASILFTFDDPLLDFPRPTLNKIVPIGGIHPRESGKTEGLDEELNSAMSARPHSVLVSFGSICLSRFMPEEYKQSLLAVFDAFPNVTFIWKYERASDLPAGDRKNVVVREWMQQPAVLADPRLSFFLTHAGMGSTQEAASRGVPLITVPMFADQYRNARMMSRAGSSLFVEKTDLATPDVLLRAVKQMIEENERFRTRASFIASMMSSRPLSVRQQLVKNVEFAAQFGPLDMLDMKAARSLFYFQYHLWDVYLFFATLISLAIFAVFKILSFSVKTIGKVMSRKMKQQ